MEYSWPSSVNVANFVTVRPQLNEEKRSMNFNLWRKQMVCLVESQDVAGFINGEVVEPQQSDEQKLWRRSDRLVKGWILGSIGADVLPEVCELETAREVWLELEKIFNGDKTSVSEIQPSDELNTSNFHQLTMGCTTEKYPWPSSVNVANFVTVRPQLNEKERSRNFKIWRQQMICFVESQDVAGFITGKMVKPQQADEQLLWRRSDRLVKGWILGSIGTDVLQYVCELETALEVWLQLEKIFNPIPETKLRGQNTLRHYVPLYKAAITGDWETAQTKFFQRDSSHCISRISMNQETTLHVAVQCGTATAHDFVKEMVKRMDPEHLAFVNSSGQTALHVAAMIGNTEAAKAMLEKNPDLLYMWDNRKLLPVTHAAMFGRKNTVTYLISVFESNWKRSILYKHEFVEFFIEIICYEFFDVALELVNNYPDLARESGYSTDRHALSVLAEMERAFPSRQRFSWWEKLIYDLWKRFKTMLWKVIKPLVSRMKDIKDKKEVHKQALQLAKKLCLAMERVDEYEAHNILRDSMFRAAACGINEVVELIMEMYPSVIDSRNIMGRNIMHVAVSNRFENIFNLIYSMSDRLHILSNVMDLESDNLMHICARLGPPHRLNIVPGAALQMQRELQWFNEIEKFINPTYKTWVNNAGKTAKILFTEQHQELKSQGERWMKDTATACSIATALIATVVFAAAFTVPGGVSSETGLPVFSGERAFILFATTNAASLFTSITSLMMFLAILTSRYAEQDFLHVLPQRLCFGLLSLFFSVIFMLIAFSAALYLELRTEVIWFILPVAICGWLPVASFVFLQFPLLIDVVKSTYGPGIFGKKTKRVFY